MVGAVLVIAGAVLLWSRREPPGADVPAPPRAAVRVTEDGVRIAVFDLEALTAWCRDVDLPDPPRLREAEPVVADGLREALHQAVIAPGPETYGRVGQIAEGLDAHEAAEAYFRLAEKEDPGDFRWSYYLGCVYQETGRRDDAIAEFERAAEKNSAYPTTAARLGQLYLDSGRPDDARPQFERYDSARPDDWFGLVGLARIALSAGEPEQALELLTRAAERGPGDFQVNFQLGRTYTALGDREQAKVYFDRAEAAPQGGWFRMRDPLIDAMHDASSSVGELQTQFERLSGTGDWAMLADLGEQIVRRRSGDVRMLGNLAGFYRKLGRYDDAHDALDRGLAHGVDQIRLHNLRAEVYLAQKEYEPTIAATDSVLALNAEDPRALSVRARALTMLGRYPEAETWMRRSLDANPADLSNRVVLAEILLGQGREDDAMAVLREVLAAAPDHPYARERIRQIEAGE